MEFWLKENENKSFRLPVLPSEYTMTSGNAVTTVNANEIGEIALFSGERLYSITLSSMFPNKVYPFCQYISLISPSKSVELIDEWRKGGTILRLIITDTKVNIPVIIEHFRWGERDGSRDIYYEIILREYRYLKAPTKKATIIPKRPVPQSSTTTTQQRTHTVVSGDTLWAIAVKYYGNGSKYTNIANANKDKVKNPNLIYPGQVLVIP